MLLTLTRFARVFSCGVTITVLSAMAADASPISIQVDGTTTGCFGIGCTPEDLSSSAAFTYDGTTFTTTTDSTGAAADIALGSFFRLTANAGNFTGSLPFTLDITFTAPASVTASSTTFTATLNGQLNGGGGSVWINFENTFQTFTFPGLYGGTGSFQFAVLDIGTAVANTNGLDKGETLTLYGHIQDATMPGLTTPVPAPVPEPTSLVLLGTGVLAFVAWRRRTNAQ